MTTTAQTLTLMALAAGTIASPAQTTNLTAAATTPATPPPSGIEQTIQDIKNPVKWFSWGADFRVREEYFNNILTLNPDAPRNEQSYMRFRARIWASLLPVEDVSFNVRLSDETREWFKPAGYTAFAPHSGYDWREGFFDNLNMQWRNIGGQPLVATVGRQDILLGDGWLTGDGTPQDGSWTYYLDAARVSYELPKQHTTIQAIGILQDAKDDGWLGTINNQNLFETEQNEKGAILWVANSSLPAANVDGFFFYKEDRAVKGVSRGDNAYIYTPGGRVSGLVAEHWRYSAQGAYQFGRKQDPLVQFPEPTTAFRPLDAFAANTKLTYLLKDSLNNQFSLAYEFLSGDNPNTGKDEMFDNLWGRWPRWSEIGLYSFAAETRIGNEANLHRVGPSWTFNPVKPMEVSLAYYALFSQYGIATRAANPAVNPGAAARSPFAGNAEASDAGTFRGHFMQAVLKYQFSKHLSGHLWSEFELPGDYYAHRATWSFLRAEAMLTF